MAKTIITQHGDIVNFSNLLIVYVEADEAADRSEVWQLIGTDNNGNSVILGEYADEQTAEQAKADMANWLGQESYSTFRMPVGD